jgi:bacterioferritin (cytochrome b1)
MSKEPMDRDAVTDGLRRAIPLQLRSAVTHTVAAGSLVGLTYVGLAPVLWTGAQDDLEDARRLVEKLVTLGGAFVDGPADVELATDPDAIVDQLVDLERETIEALQDIIPATGQGGESEALEHRLEHMIMRKQEHVDTLLRARRG